LSSLRTLDRVSKKLSGESMENRPQKTLPRTLNCGSGCTTILLLLFFVLPALWALDRSSAPEPPEHADHRPVAVLEIPQQVVKAYNIVKARRPEIDDTHAWRMSELVLSESSKHRLDPLLVLALIQTESDFQHTAISPMGARGLMQIMPDTGKYLAEAWHREHGLEPTAFRPELLDDPVHNIRLGTFYLQGLRKQFRNLRLALTAYNLGPGEVQNRLDNDLEFPNQYAAVVLDTYRSYKATLSSF
jgi:soluble lytic murein transglycosylase